MAHISLKLKVQSDPFDKTQVHAERIRTHEKLKDTSNALRQSSGATSMAELMQSVKKPFITVHKGDIVKGIITKLTPEILVDINTKTEAVVLEKDKRILRTILSHVKVGDEVLVSVLNTESDFGNSVVSLRRFMEDIVWKRLEEKLQSQEKIYGVVRESTRGGFLVDSEVGVGGFLPTSLMASEGVSFGQDIVGKKISLYITELNREAHKVIFSQKPILGEKEFATAISQIKPSQKVMATVTSVTSFGVFVSVAVDDVLLDGLIHISEISWEEVVNLSDLFKTGQHVEAVIFHIDKDAKRVDLSIKRLTADPFQEMMKHLSIDQQVKGAVVRINSQGVVVNVVVNIDGEQKTVEGLIRKEKIPPTVSYEVGKEVVATVSQIEANKHRLLLTPVLKEKPIGYR